MKKYKNKDIKTTQDYFKVANKVTDAGKYMLKMAFEEFA